MTIVKSKAVKIPVQETERIKKVLKEKNLIKSDLKIATTKKFSYIPIKESVKKLEFEVISFEFEENKKKINSYKELLEIPDNIRDILPSSFDIIGEIALIKLQDELIPFKKKIGNAILKSIKNVKTICLIKPVKGEYRIRDIEIISGENNTETIHREYGLDFFVDIKKTYFSPRLANERKRISDLVKPGEVIVDMFTGVAPFPILISKFSNPKIIYAIDKNKDSIKYAKRNIRLNKAYDKIQQFNEDATEIKNIIPKTEVVNRVIMNLPFSSYDFFDCALSLCKKKLIIHYYEIIDENDIENRKKDLETIANKRDIKLNKIRIQKIKSYSPREFYICFDITAKKKTNADVA